MTQTALAAQPAAKKLPETLWVRIHPYNPAQGHKKKTFIVFGYPTVFTADAGWYELPARLAVQLKKFRNNPNDESSKPVFQVVTLEKAQELGELAKRKAAEADNPHRPGANPLQNRQEIPKPVNLDVLKEPAGVAAPPAAGTLEDALEEVLAEEASVSLDEKDYETPVGRGDLSTEDLAKPAEKPAGLRPRARKKD